ncbi:prolyl oligopeptidase family serine peptidase [bacterium]|nr:prolyl oligopeptidase family serine peptidase [bacterium]
MNWPTRALCLLALLRGTLWGQPQLWPHWLENGTQFWYRNDGAGGEREFVLVDAVQGWRRPAFDHARVARLLSRRSGQSYKARRLPFYGLRFEASQLMLCGPVSWRLNLTSYELVQAFGELESLPVLGEVASWATGTLPSRIQFVNRTGAEVQLAWLNSQGQPQNHAQLTAGEQLDQPTFEGQVWLVEHATTGARLACFQAAEGPARAIIDCPPSHDPRISPDGSFVVEVRDHNLWLRGRGQDRALSSDGRAGEEYAEADLRWSPDSHKLYALRGCDNPQIFLLESGRQVTPDPALFVNPLALHSPRWSATSERVTFVYQERGHRVLRLLAVEAATGRVKCLIEESSPTFVCDSQNYFCHWLGDREVLWMSERSGWNHLWLFDGLEGLPKRAVTGGPWVVQKVAVVDEARRQVSFWAGAVEPGRDPYYAKYCRANLDEPGLMVLTHEDGDHQVLPSPNGAFLVDTWSRVDRAPVTDLLKANDGAKICRLEESRASGNRPRPFVAKGRDGETEIYGVIYFPRDVQKGRKYPVVEHIYASPDQFATPKSYQAGTVPDQRLADRGLIVVQCDGMGTWGRSKAFHDVCYKNLRDAGFADRKAWMLAAARRYPQMDLTRVGIYGSSAGGASAVAALLWHHDFYRVAVADCGNHDCSPANLDWMEQWMGWPIGPEYADNANLTWAARLQGKLLLMVGDQDDKVPPASTLHLAQALDIAGKPHELWVLKGGRHCVSETQEGWRRLTDFLVKNL